MADSSLENDEFGATRYDNVASDIGNHWLEWTVNYEYHFRPILVEMREIDLVLATLFTLISAGVGTKGIRSTKSSTTTSRGMDFAFKMMNFVLQMMNFVFKMLNFVSKMINVY